MSQLRVDWERRLLHFGNKSLDILSLSKDIDFLKWVADSGHFLTQANLVFNTLSPALTWEFYHIQEVYSSRFGIPSLKVGYPYIAFKNDDSSLSVPLFIWDISLEPIDKVGIKWMFSRYVHALPVLNPVILNHSSFDQINQLINPLLKQNSINFDDFRTIVKAVDPSFFEDDLIVSVPKDSQIKAQSNFFKIYNSLSLNILENFSANNDHPLYSYPLMQNQMISLPGHSFGLQVLFPEQAAAFHFAQENTPVIISGTSGSGKKHLLNYMITNALSNGRNCLIISENNGFLADINASFVKNKMENLVLVQPNKGHYGQLVKRLAFIIQQEKNSPVFAGDNFKEILASCQRLMVKLSAAYKASRRKIFGDYDWAEVVSLFLQSARGVDNKLINIRLPTDLFVFNPEEFESLAMEISPMQKGFSAINTLQHPLNILHTGVLGNTSLEEISDYFNLQLNEERNNFRFILTEYLNVLTQYSDALNINLFKQIQGIIERIEEIENKFDGFLDLFGNDFLFTKNFSLLLYSKLADRGKKILEAREMMVQLLNKLKVSIESQQFWSFPEPPEHISHTHLGDWINYLPILKESAIEWQQHLPDFINEEVLRASSNNVHASTVFKDQFSYLENLMDEAIENFNSKSLYLERLDHQALTLIKRQKWLELTVNSFDLILVNIRDFSTFYQWQLSWKELSPGAKAVIQVLSTINPADWVMTFKNWYLHQILLKNYHHYLPDTTLPLETYEADWELLQSMMPRQIQSLWFQKRRERIKQWKKDEKTIFQKMIGWLENSQLKEYDYLFFLKDMLPLWLDCFPVFCLTVKQANELFQQYPTIEFDHVYWGDVQYSTIQEIAKFQALGKSTTYFYNPAFDKNENENELINKYPMYKMSKIHGFYQGNPWQQWRGGQVTVNAIKEASVHFHRINGVFQPNGVNEGEATFLINELSKIRYSSTEFIPSVGIICLTEMQRNFISTLIFKVCHEESTLKSHFNNLKNNGLEILMPNEIESRHFNLVYLLTSFEDVNLLLKSSFSSINVEQIAALPLDNFTVITSLKRAELIEMDEKDDKDIFIPYLKFLEAINDRDLYALEYEFQKFRFKKEEPFSENYHAFWAELMHRLDSKQATFEFQKNIFFNQDYFPFFIKKQTVQANYIFFLLDGFHANTAHTDFIWEIRQTNKLKKYGIELLPVWTVNWWKNNVIELKRLVANINDMN